MRTTELGAIGTTTGSQYPTRRTHEPVAANEARASAKPHPEVAP